MAAGKKTRELRQQQPCGDNFSASSSSGWTRLALALHFELLLLQGMCVGEEMAPLSTKNQQLPPLQVLLLQTGICVIRPEVAWDCQETAVSWRSKAGKELGEKLKVSALRCLSFLVEMKEKWPGAPA